MVVSRNVREVILDSEPSMASSRLVLVTAQSGLNREETFAGQTIQGRLRSILSTQVD